MFIKLVVLVWNRVGSILSYHQLSGHSCCIEEEFMIMSVVSELIPETSKGLQSTIDCFMSTGNLTLCTLFALATIIQWSSHCGVMVVSSICFNHFAGKQHWLHKLSVNRNVRPLTRRERTMAWYYLSSLNTSADSISKTRTFEFVTVVTRVKWIASPLWFLLILWVSSIEALEINTIVIDLACSAFIIFQSIFETDLKIEMWEKEKRNSLCFEHGELTTWCRIFRNPSFTGVIAFREVGADTRSAFSSNVFVG